MIKCITIAECSALHLKDLDRAKRLIEAAASTGANYVKFQKRNPEESTPKHLWNKPHPNPEFAHGSTYLEHRKNLEFTIQQHKELFNFCTENKIGYSTSVWDITSAKEVIDEINPNYIKIPSAQNTNYKLLEYIFTNYKKPVHISLGMLESEEKNILFNFCKSYNQTIFYYCTSIYPCPLENLNLLEIFMLYEEFGIAGFSNHNPNIDTDIAGFSLGASFIEKHFTNDKNILHTDASSSLDANEMTELVSRLKNIEMCLTFKKEISDKEREQKEKLKN